MFPVKLDLKASRAASAVSESPRTTNVLGSIFYFCNIFFLAKAGMCSGTTTYNFSSLTLTTKELIALRVGPLST